MTKFNCEIVIKWIYLKQLLLCLEIKSMKVLVIHTFTIACRYCHAQVTSHFSGVTMSAMASRLFAFDCSGAGERNHQSSSSPAFVREIHRLPADSPRKGSVTRIMFPFDDVVQCLIYVMSSLM